MLQGCNIFFPRRQLIYNYPEQLFADAGVMAIEHADFDGVERLALVTGGEIVSTFDEPEKVKLGQCDLIEEVSSVKSRSQRPVGTTLILRATDYVIVIYGACVYSFVSLECMTSVTYFL